MSTWGNRTEFPTGPAAAPAITACVYVPKATAPAHHTVAGFNDTESSLHCSNCAARLYLKQHLTRDYPPP